MSLTMLLAAADRRWRLATRASRILLCFLTGTAFCGDSGMASGMGRELGGGEDGASKSSSSSASRSSETGSGAAGMLKGKQEES